MVLEYNRVVLRPIEPKDAKQLHEITHDIYVREYLPGVFTLSEQKALDDIVETYSRCDFINDFYYAITLGSVSGLMIGVLLVKRKQDSSFEACNIIGAPYRGNGYIEAALTAFFNSMPKGSRIIFEVDEENFKSIHSLRKLNLVSEYSTIPGHLRYTHTI